MAQTHNMTKVRRICPHCKHTGMYNLLTQKCRKCKRRFVEEDFLDKSDLVY